MTQNELKQAVARAAISYIADGIIVGVGTGSTANFFIDELSYIKTRIKGAVASSQNTAERLRQHGIPIFDLNTINTLSIYVDGADEINPNGAMIKGGGGALTREKIIASAAQQFICIADTSKWVNTLGTFPLPIEVIPMAQAIVMRHLHSLGGIPHLRTQENAPFQTDNGNFIIDVTGLHIHDPINLETQINNVPGVVTVGLFAQRGADICLLSGIEGVHTHVFHQKNSLK